MYYGCFAHDNFYPNMHIRTHRLTYIVLFPRPCCLRQRCRRAYSNTDTTQATVPRPSGPWPAVIRLPTPPPLPMDSACPPSALIARLPYLTLTSANSPAATRHPGLQAFHTYIPQSSTPHYVHYSRCTFPLRMLWCHPNTTLMSAGSIGPEGSRGLHRARARAHCIPRSHRITTGMAGLGLGSRRSWQKGNSSGRSSRYSHVCLYISILNCSCQEHLTFLGTLHLGFVIRIPRPPVQ